MIWNIIAFQNMMNIFSIQINISLADMSAKNVRMFNRKKRPYMRDERMKVCRPSYCMDFTTAYVRFIAASSLKHRMKPFMFRVICFNFLLHDVLCTLSVFTLGVTQ